jgi:hypothetical protein
MMSWTIKWWWHVARMGAMRNAYKILVGKPEGKRPLGRPRHRWEHNTRVDLGKRWESMEWMHLTQDRDRWRALVDVVKSLRVP